MPVVIAAPPTTATPAPPATEVSGVTVIAHRLHTVEGVTVTAQLCPQPGPRHYPVYSDPKVVDAYPPQGAVVAAGPMTVRITFDQPMSCYSDLTIIGADEDPCDGAGVWSLPGRRTWTTQCRFVAAAHYVLQFEKADGGPGYVGLSGRAARPFVLRFKTADPELGEATTASGVDPGPPAAGAPSVACSDTGAANSVGGCVRVHAAPPSPRR